MLVIWGNSITLVLGVIASRIRSTKIEGGQGNRKRDLLDHDSVAASALLPACDHARIILVGDDHFIAGLEIDAEDQGLHRLGRVARDRDLFGIAAEFVGQVAAHGLDSRLEMRHMCWTGDSLVNRRSRIIWSRTWVGDGQTPPLLKLMALRSLSKARWISDQ